MNIALLGCGVVGSGVKEILDASKQDVKITKILVKDKNEIKEARMTTDIQEILKSDVDVIVECIGGIDIPFQYISQALQHKKHVVTSNKKVLATHYRELVNMARKNGVILAFEASVGGGIPWLENIRHIKRVDRISAFEGIFNGTTNYILDRMTSQGVDFQAALQEAQALGYAESDPTDDIDGYDVKYKCCLTANVIWNTSLPLEDILFFGIRNVRKKDILYAAQKNAVLKLTGKAVKTDKGIQILVIPTFLSSQENMAQLPKNLNYGKIKSEYLGESCYIGEGAGKYPTAHAVVQDILSILEKRELSSKISEEFPIKKDYISRFYIRSQRLSSLENFVSDILDEETILTKNVNLLELLPYIDENTWIAEIRL
ncbi:homoserine dehydrogenase [Fusobacterium necrophorum]|uniref:homoserine dehydrogenase n=1 Tax=Fusobacterium necrophorum TaxID=859 RepID=UPI003FA01A79